MLSQEQAVQALADRVGCAPGCGADRRRSLEQSLVPIVRCALRNGLGHPRLVRWIDHALCSTAGVDPIGRAGDFNQTAASLAHLLCNSLLEQLRSSRSSDAPLETMIAS